MVYMYHSFLIHSSADGHLGCFHVLAIIKQCCDEHWGARVSFRSNFLGVYAQKWDCWGMSSCDEEGRRSPQTSGDGQWAGGSPLTPARPRV